MYEDAYVDINENVTQHMKMDLDDLAVAVASVLNLNNEEKIEVIKECIIDLLEYKLQHKDAE